MRGSGFNSSKTATVGREAASVTFMDENTLTLIVPTVSSGPNDIVLTNSDGTTYTLQNGLTVPWIRGVLTNRITHDQVLGILFIVGVMAATALLIFIKAPRQR